MVCQLAYIPKEELVHVVGLAPTKSERTLDLQSSAFAAQPHLQNGFLISDLGSAEI